MSSENKIHIFRNNENTSLRLDLYIAQLHPEKSRSQIQKLIKDNKILVNNKNSKASLILKPGDQVEVHLTEDQSRELEAFQQKIPLEIVFEDEHIIVINKSAGLVTHPGAGNSSGTVVNALFDKLYKNDPVRPGVVHRLDKDTRGLLVLAKTQLAYDELSEQFRSKQAGRIYQALCFGKIKPDQGKIENKLARSPKNRKKFASQEIGKIAITHYKTLKEGPVSLIELSLETGRTHQIRVHLSEKGHPILNDPIYSSVKKINDIQDPVLKSKVKRLDHMSLVAIKLCLKHPRTNDDLIFEIPAPKEFEELML